MSLPSINHASWRLLGLLASSLLLGSYSPTMLAADMTLTQTITIASLSNKDLQAARYTVVKARARLLQAGLTPNPRLDVGAKNDLLFGNDGEYVANVGISQQFSVTNRIARQQDVARVDIALAYAEIRQAELRLANEIATRFYSVLSLNRQIDEREQLIAVNQKLLAGSRNRYKAAEVSELDVNTAQLELQRLTQERVLLQSQRSTQLAQLNQLLGRPATQTLMLDNTLPVSEPLSALDEQQQQASRLRPDLQFALLNADRAGANQALAHAQRWEDWTVGIGLEQGHQVISGVPPQGTSRALGFSLSIPLPLVNKNQGNIAEAAATSSQAYARIEALKLGISNEVASAYAETQRLQQTLAAYQHNMLALGTRNVRLALQGYNQGLIPIGDVVRIQRQQAELNIAYLNTLDQYLQALARLQAATADDIKTLPHIDATAAP